MEIRMNRKVIRKSRIAIRTVRFSIKMTSEPGQIAWSAVLTTLTAHTAAFVP
jgi:hypothetical protein